MWTYIHTDELYHHGIKGQKWGRRRYQNKDGTLTPAGKKRQDYKDSKSELRDARKEYARETSGFRSFGIKGIARAVKAETAVTKANTKAINAEAAYKASKAKNAAKAEKAEFKAYVKGMNKTGLVDSYNDRMSGGKSKALYNSIVHKKGKEYADRVQQKVQSKTYAAFATAAAVSVGLGIVSGVLSSLND